MMRSLAFSLALTAATTLSTLAHGQSLDDAYLRLNRALGDLQDAQALRPVVKVASLTGVISNITQLHAATAAISGPDAQLMAQSLEFNATLLERAAATDDASMADDLLETVRADLAVKVAGGGAMGLGSRFRGAVNIEIKTLRSGRVVGGYVVGLSPARYSGATPQIVLERATTEQSGATGRVAPGRYEISARDATTVVRRELRDIGLNAQDTVVLDLLLP